MVFLLRLFVLHRHGEHNILVVKLVIWINNMVTVTVIVIVIIMVIAAAAR